MKTVSLRYYLGYIFGGVTGIAFCQTTAPLWMEFLGAVAVCFVAHRIVVSICKK